MSVNYMYGIVPWNRVDVTWKIMYSASNFVRRNLLWINKVMAYTK